MVLTTPVVLPMTIWAGADFRFAWVYREPPIEGADPSTGAFIDLSGADVSFVVSTKAGVQFTFDDSSGITVTGQIGLIELILSASQTIKLPFKAYVSDLPGLATAHYSLEAVLLDGSTEILASGPLTVNGS